MNVSELIGESASRLGEEMHAFMTELFPICRSITGEGLRETLRRIGERIPLATTSVPTGTRVLDWSIPPEWNIRDAYVLDPAGERVIDFREHNLHVMGYSVPVRRRMTLEELRPHLHTIPEHPDWIPYRTSYYNPTWGFCLSESRLQTLAEGDYEVCIDSSLEDGELTYGECLLQGDSPAEVLISTHVCHPSMGNDNLSGVALATFLAEALAPLPRRLTYRFLFVPGTIGALAWLHANEGRLSLVRHGLVLSCVGDGGTPTYKRSRRGDAEVDRAAAHVLRHSGQSYELLDFTPYGYDERQYCSPGFDLPVGSFARTPWGRYPEYHSSADDLDLVRPWAMADSFSLVLALLSVLDDDDRFLNLNPKGEPQLGRRGLYRAIGGRPDLDVLELALLWVLNLSDGRHSLLDIAERAQLEFATVKGAADVLVEHDLLRRAEECP